MAEPGHPLKEFENTEQFDQVVALAASIEIAHNASLLQDDIIDKADSRRSVEAAHKVYGPSTSVFASDFMISRASRMLTEAFPNVHMSQLFSTIVSNLVYGELIQAKRDFKSKTLIGDAIPEVDYDAYFESYIAKTYYKTASMISLGCRGLGLIFNLDIENQRRLFNFGAHLGVAFQIHDDILDFTQDSSILGKPAFNDLKEGIVTAPIIYALLDLKSEGEVDSYRELTRMVQTQFENKVKDVPLGASMLFDSRGIELADKLSIDHIREALSSLQGMEYPSNTPIIDPTEEHFQALVGLALKVKTRKY